MSGTILVADKNGNPVGGVVVNAADLRANAQSILMSRMSLGRHGTSFMGERDYYQILGYPREITMDDLLAKFDRDPMAGRIVEFPAEETWRDTPTVKDGRDKDAVEDTDFCKAWSDFAERMRIYYCCQRVDTLAGIGRFGVLLIGVAGGGDLNTEVKRVSSLDSVIYLRPYHEGAVTIREYQTNPQDPRFGLPHMYGIAISDMAGANSQGGLLPTRTMDVHWSRVIHVAEGLLENEVFGRPRLQRVVNLLDDVLKVVGGSAEATWKLMRKGLLLNADDTEVEFTAEQKDALREQFDEYDHNLRRFMFTQGMKATDLGSEVVDPSGLFDVIVTLISVATGIPKRLLLGSERGELASSQDAANWAGRIAARQLNFAEAVILRPLIDRLVKWGALAKPKNGRYTVVWDALFELTDTEKATVAKTWAEAAEKAATATGGPVMTAEEYRGEFTPFAAELPPELVEARADAKQAKQAQAMPAEGEDVLDQVEKVVANYGFGTKEAKAFRMAVNRLMTRAA